MGRIVNKPQNKKKELPANFYRDICYGEYVLVLGEDVILKEEYGNGSAKKYINDEFELWLKQNPAKKASIVGATNSGIMRRCYLREFLSTQWKYDVNEISDSLVRLLKTKFFPLVLTTGFDGYVEKLMRKIYGKDLVVMNFFENKGDLRKNNEFDTLPPTLYYVFGKAQASDELTFAYDDDDYIDALCKWMGSDRPQGLIEYIKKKKILVIGGNNKDWYFRFFWRSLRKSLLERKDDVAISLGGECDLLEFLDRNNINNHGGTARKFMKKLSNKLCNPDNALLKDIHEGRYRQFGGLFISYAHEDYPIVCRIHAFLVSLNIKVWFDNVNLQGGAAYDERIHNAISQCKIFMPILSSNTKGDWKTESRKNANEKRYFIKEWEEVLNNKNAKIIPVVLNGFNIKEDKSIFPPERFDRTIVDWAKEGESGIEKALRDKINDIYCS